MTRRRTGRCVPRPPPPAQPPSLHRTTPERPPSCALTTRRRCARRDRCRAACVARNAAPGSRAGGCGRFASLRSCGARRAGPRHVHIAAHAAMKAADGRQHGGVTCNGRPPFRRLPFRYPPVRVLQGGGGGCGSPCVPVRPRSWRHGCGVPMWCGRLVRPPRQPADGPRRCREAPAVHSAAVTAPHKSHLPGHTGGCAGDRYPTQA
jgi:hypothetical protein